MIVISIILTNSGYRMMFDDGLSQWLNTTNDMMFNICVFYMVYIMMFVVIYHDVS